MDSRIFFENKKFKSLFNLSFIKDISAKTEAIISQKRFFKLKSDSKKISLSQGLNSTELVTLQVKEDHEKLRSLKEIIDDEQQKDQQEVYQM